MSNLSYVFAFLQKLPFNISICSGFYHAKLSPDFFLACPHVINGVPFIYDVTTVSNSETWYIVQTSAFPLS